MGSQTKTDNGHLREKLDLRRYFLNKYHAGDPLRVFDCCQGSGKIWQTLRAEYNLASYWGVDVKPKKGRLKIESSRVLECGLDENVIDIDTYGSPWKHYYTICKNLKEDKTLFLTWGTVSIGGGNVDASTEWAIGWATFKSKPPKALYCKMQKLALSILLSKGCSFGNIIKEAKIVEVDGNASYIGLRISPGGKPCQ